MIFRDILFSERCLTVFVNIWNLKSVFIAVNEMKALDLLPVLAPFHALPLMHNNTLVFLSHESLSMCLSTQNPSSRYKCNTARCHQGAVLLQPAEPNMFILSPGFAHGPGLELLPPCRAWPWSHRHRQSVTAVSVPCSLQTMLVSTTGVRKAYI